MKKSVFGSIEAGGTKFICAVGTSPADLSEAVRIPTTSPDETLAQCIAYFSKAKERVELTALGIACFGPLDLNPRSLRFGSITTTPKPGWQNTPITTRLAEALQIPVKIDTDVNGAALAEQRWGAGRNLDQIIYITVGTGIGGGALVDGKPLHGLVHPEMGHISVVRHPQDSFPGICSFHGDCFEGLASGPALQARWKADPATLPEDHPCWELEAHYLAQAISSFCCILSPQRIIVGGGVMHHPFLLPLIREKCRTVLNGYIDSPLLQEQIDEFIVAPELGDSAGVLGGIALAALNA